MSDDELDRDWKPSARPQSTMARSFSLALNDLFKIDNSLADLDAAVSEKKQKVSSQTSELEALEARLRATEERLKAAANQKAVANSSPGRSSPSGRSSPHQRTPLGDTFSGSPAKAEKPTSPLATEFGSTSVGGSRPATSTTRGATGRPNSAWKGEAHPLGPMPGAMPPTPGASEGEYSRSGSVSESEYVLVEGEKRADFDSGEDGDMPPPPPLKNVRHEAEEDENEEDSE